MGITDAVQGSAPISRWATPKRVGRFEEESVSEMKFVSTSEVLLRH